MSVIPGVTLYSMTNEWLAGRYGLAELVDEVGKRKLGPGVEIVGFQSLRGFPSRVSEDEIGDFVSAIERNGLTLTALGGNADIALRADAWLDVDQSVEYMRPQIELAARLGFPIVRTQIGLEPRVLEKLEPIAAKYKIHLGMEVHAPEGPNTPKILQTREAYRRIDSEWLGFIPDFSSCMRAIPKGMLAKFGSYGLSSAGLELLARAWAGHGTPIERYNAFAKEARELGEAEFPINKAMMVFSMFGREKPEEWREVLPQIRHIHGKFYDIDADLTSPSIDYRTLMKIFAEADRDITMSTEWEGHAFADLDEQDSFELVAKHHAMVAKILAS